jgi:hypothetical protein
VPKRQVGERWDCSACGKALVGARTINGKVAPIEQDVTPGGNCFLFRRGDEIRVAVLTGPIVPFALRHGFELRMNHFATCPEKERFRQGSLVGSATPEPGGSDDGASDPDDAGVGGGTGAGGPVPDDERQAP